MVKKGMVGADWRAEYKKRTMTEILENARPFFCVSASRGPLAQIAPGCAGARPARKFPCILRPPEASFPAILPFNISRKHRNPRLDKRPQPRIIRIIRCICSFHSFPFFTTPHNPPTRTQTMHTPPVLATTPRATRRPARRIARMTARAFTLLEILVVIAIAAMILGLAVANLDKIFGSATEKTAKMKITALETPLFSYRFDMGDYPSSAEGLRALITAPADKAARWRGPYLKKGQDDITDPWGEPFQYSYPGTRNKAGYDLWSKGPDKQDGTADDIGSWPAEAAASPGIPGLPGQ
jgi:general secretion pathway protein G